MHAASIRAALAIALALTTVGGVAASAAGRPAPPPCSDKHSAGGDWSTYGADLQGTQHQVAEDVIDVGNVATLTQAWITDDTGYQSPPPIVADGCVFINTGGHIEALDLATGAPVWTSTGADTTGTFAVTVVHGRVHVGLDNGGRPQAAAFDEHSGRAAVGQRPGVVRPRHDATGERHRLRRHPGAVHHRAGLRPGGARGLRTARRGHRCDALPVDDAAAGRDRRRVRRRRGVGHADRRCEDRLPLRRHVQPRVQDEGERVRRRRHQARPGPGPTDLRADRRVVQGDAGQRDRL